MVHIIKDVQNILGTFVTITIVHPDIMEGISALHAAFNEVHRVHDLMNAHREDSEVGALNREGYYDGVSDDTRHVIQVANHFSELSDGAFDITVLPLLEFWKKSLLSKNVPTDSEISNRLELVDYRNIFIEDKKICFRKPGMGITLAGVAKGYAVDKAIEALSQCNIRHALVNAGGDIGSIGGKTEALPWRIAIRDPRNKTRIIDTIELYNQAVATSGTYQRPFIDIIDPKVGRFPQGVLSSTVVAKRAIDADALTTCIFILGEEKGMELARGLKGVKVFVITSDGSVLN